MLNRIFWILHLQTEHASCSMLLFYIIICCYDSDCKESRNTTIGFSVYHLVFYLSIFLTMFCMEVICINLYTACLSLFYTSEIKSFCIRKCGWKWSSKNWPHCKTEEKKTCFIWVLFLGFQQCFPLSLGLSKRGLWYFCHSLSSLDLLVTRQKVIGEGTGKNNNALVLL